MKKYILTGLISLFVLMAAAQNSKGREIYVFRITNYILDINDSTKLVQVELPEGYASIIVGQESLLKPNYSNGQDDSTNIGWGKCQLIKGNYYYFTVHKNGSKRLPMENDLLLTYFDAPETTYRGSLYQLNRNAIYLDRVTGGSFYDFAGVLSLNATKEKELLDSMVADIKLTGREYETKAPDQNQTISGGVFDGKKLFNAMQQITVENLEDFISFMMSRPEKYKGNNWKISEVFATWMIGKTPMGKRH